jgi:hypothetical protein
VIPQGQVIELDGHTYDATFTLTDADSTPTYEVFQQGNTTAIMTGSMTRRSTGTYYVSITTSSGNGFTIGKTHQVKMLATVGGALGKSVLSRFLTIPTIVRAAVSDSAPTATGFTTTLTETVNGHWRNAYLRFTSGSLSGQVCKINDYVGSTKLVTFVIGYTAAPANGVTFEIENS